MQKKVLTDAVVNFAECDTVIEYRSPEEGEQGKNRVTYVKIYVTQDGGTLPINITASSIKEIHKLILSIETKTE